MITNIHYNKYIKYKNKYIGIKNNDKQQEELKGGGYFYEQNELIKKKSLFGSNPYSFTKNFYHFSNIYLKVNLINSDIIKKYNIIRKSILKNNSVPLSNFHMTLLIFEINLDYPFIGDRITYFDKNLNKKKIRKDLDFLNQDIIKNDFNQIFSNVILTETNYEILGKLNKIKLNGQEINLGVKDTSSSDCVKYSGNYFVSNYTVNDKNLITKFRTRFYNNMNKFIKQIFIDIGGKEKYYLGYRVDNKSDPDYTLLFYDNFSKHIPFIAIKNFYYGKNNWNPHISIFNMGELVQNNMKFLENYIMEFLTSHDKNKTDLMVFDELKKSNSISEIFSKKSKQKITITDIEFELHI